MNEPMTPTTLAADAAQQGVTDLIARLLNPASPYKHLSEPVQRNLAVPVNLWLLSEAAAALTALSAENAELKAQVEQLQADRLIPPDARIEILKGEKKSLFNQVLNMQAHLATERTHSATLAEQVAELKDKRDVWMNRCMEETSLRLAAEANVARLVAIDKPALEACRIIDEVVKEGHDNVGEMILHFLTAAEPARAALTEGTPE